MHFFTQGLGRFFVLCTATHTANLPCDPPPVLSRDKLDLDWPPRRKSAHSKKKLKSKTSFDLSLSDACM
jgi:hypothetical protein